MEKLKNQTNFCEKVQQTGETLWKEIIECFDSLEKKGFKPTNEDVLNSMMAAAAELYVTCKVLENLAEDFPSILEQATGGDDPINTGKHHILIGVKKDNKN